MHPIFVKSRGLVLRGRFVSLVENFDRSCISFLEMLHIKIQIISLISIMPSSFFNSLNLALSSNVIVARCQRFLVSIEKWTIILNLENNLRILIGFQSQLSSVLK